MQFSFNFVSLLCSSIVFEYGFCLLYEGDSCLLKHSGLIGICKSERFCQSAIDFMRIQPIFLETCGFNDFDRVICCADNLVSTTNVGGSRMYTPTPKIQKVGDKSRQKCKEYSGSFQLVFGGQLAEPHEFPHMALIGFEDNNSFQTQYSCGGSLISERFVLSAAHCTFHATYGNPKYILLGELVLDSYTDDANPEKLLIKNIIPYPEYSPFSHYHDIALFELERQPKLDRMYIKPACLNTNPSLTDGHAVATGWGRTSSSDMSKELQKVTLDIFSTDKCNFTYKRNIDLSLEYGIVEEIQVCAGSRYQSKDTCQGDSGGPLQVRNTKYSNTYNIIGITSFGKICGKPNFPGVYTRVSAYIQWIEDIVWP